MTRKALIMAGGTGGHVIPALAVAQELIDRGWQVEWLGTQRGIESRLVPEKGITLHTISVEGLRGRGVLSLFKAPFMLLRAFIDAWRVLRNVRPDIVIGLGGFASGPGGVIARMMAKPLVLHEQNAVAGTTNRLLARLTKHRLTGFPNVLSGQYVGNPVPKSVSQLTCPSLEGDTPVLLVLGGSLGAQALNERVASVVARMDPAIRPRIVHQCGRNKADMTVAAYKAAEVDAEVVEFIDDMAEAYKSASVLICRSGALTVSEVACVAKPAIFVPFPFAIDDHQTANAKFLSEAGTATVVPQSHWNDEEVCEIISSYLTPSKTLIDALQTQYQQAIRNADIRVADYVERVCKKVSYEKN
ncbi:MAG: undecaprenyldiphospho-muramoylpentapeptide beta-N-acetylglucosaminyltransferase [Gammaproteobacteria bacterium]|nr:undecaprenyldiphospho-muramoylpentapeptide beta-N-acetylglucosaminyltransferase [Gammaproteobacteria bacterium]